MHDIDKRYQINKRNRQWWLYQRLTTSHVESCNYLNRWKLFIFFTLFYTFLFTIFICLMKLVLYKIIDADKPYLTGSYSSLQNSPGLSIIPVSSTEMNLIAYKVGYPDTYLIFQDMMIAFLSQYEYYSYTGNNLRNCLIDNDSQSLTYETLIETSCAFNLDWSYVCNINNNFGYDSGSPCVIIKLNRLYGWLPEIGSHENGIKICCKGANPNDDILLGDICMYDAYIHTEEGCQRQCAFIPHQYFPYLNQESYQSPLIFLQLQNVKKNVLMQIHCETVNLPNTMSVNFALLVD
ncbi:Sodium/potassium-transporting ATPase subunit beta [Schistosoma japonicum]|uniref:Sodium/potassium-transporting ATPase subunit beta n=1 Tax=Schistosoma japonicum TaxID=6182 RepID=A0A4Z2DPI1_SCHJA|nr:Sodium/potassium-transporting ATPase subunit beta [Schistosoma japonicum]TNN18349.1 Sodium/potassium-transporting ATPase subunit beta [Schistosoma japonicum]